MLCVANLHNKLVTGILCVCVCVGVFAFKIQLNE